MHDRGGRRSAGRPVVAKRPSQLGSLQNQLRSASTHATENPQLLLNDRYAERSVLGDLLGELERESLDLSSGNDVVDQAVALRADRVNRPPREDHLLRHSQPGGVEQLS